MPKQTGAGLISLLAGNLRLRPHMPSPRRRQKDLVPDPYPGGGDIEPALPLHRQRLQRHCPGCPADPHISVATGTGCHLKAELR